jgi:hypothetical protein
MKMDFKKNYSKGAYMGTHLIKISKEQFDEIEVGDRLIIENDEDKFCFVVYVEPDED